jgi:thymidylate synthase (FAD)
MCEIKLHVRTPMDCWRQWIRHRTANVNEYSTRYSIAIDAAQRTSPSEWRRQAAGNRQGSAETFDVSQGTPLSAREIELQKLARAVYEERLAAGVAREQARKDLPLSTYTEAYWKVDLHNLFHFLALRMDAHAQLEIRAYADIIGNEIVKRWCPIAWGAFIDYRAEARAFSRIEIDIIRALISSAPKEALELAERGGLISRDGAPLPRNRERDEIEQKLVLLNLPIPWGQKGAPR